MKDEMIEMRKKEGEEERRGEERAARGVSEKSVNKPADAIPTDHLFFFTSTILPVPAFHHSSNHPTFFFINSSLLWVTFNP